MGKARRKKRKRLVEDHRADEFEKRFDQYRRGEATADDVKERADKLKKMKVVPREIRGK